MIKKIYYVSINRISHSRLGSVETHFLLSGNTVKPLPFESEIIQFLFVSFYLNIGFLAFLPFAQPASLRYFLFRCVLIYNWKWNNE